MAFRLRLLSSLFKSIYTPFSFQHSWTTTVDLPQTTKPLEHEDGLVILGQTRDNNHGVRR